MESKDQPTPPDTNMAEASNDSKQHNKPKKKNKGRNRKTASKELNLYQLPIVLVADVAAALSQLSEGNQTQDDDDDEDFDYYAAEGIMKLSQGNGRVPRAAFKCSYCEYFCDDLATVDRHLHKESHKRIAEEISLIECLSLLIRPPDNILCIIDKCLDAATDGLVLTLSDYQSRNNYKDNLNKRIISDFPGCYFELYGSSLTRIGYKNSDINLNFNVPPHLNGPRTMFDLKAWFEKEEDIIDITMNVSCEVPLIKFRDKKLEVPCDVALNYMDAVKLSALLSDYGSVDKRVVPLALTFRRWAEVCNLANEEDGGFPKHAFGVLTVSYLQHVQPPVLPIVSVGSEKGKAPEALWGSARTCWKSQNTTRISELWLGLLKFFSLSYPLSEYAVSIDRYDVQKRRNRRLLWIADPFHPKKNVARTVISDLTRDYFIHCMRTTYKYFAIPQTVDGPIYHEVIRDCRGSLSRSAATKRRKTQEETVHKMLTEDKRFQSNNNDLEPEITVSENEASSNGDKCSQVTATVYQAKSLNTSLNEKYVYFSFSNFSFTGGKEPPVVCAYCFEDSHTRVACPLNHNANLVELTSDYIASLDKVCEYVLEKYAQTEEHLELRKGIVVDLEEYIVKLYPEARLELFGSTCNGFGLQMSDLDICLTFDGDDSGKDLDYTRIIKEINCHLSGYKSVRNLIPITSAKVPIVKFTHVETRLDGDISIYNILALNNTRMLKIYSHIDNRFKVLGFVMKHFAKKCNICDASRGSLSSYAYILMVIYFLQQCDPPVLPVLQELPEGQNNPEKIVEGCNVYFYEEIDNLQTVWPHFGKNTSPVGRLWCELLNFYAEKFDFGTNVICIRQKEPLLRFSKMWTEKNMAIEDPFDLNHNLAAGLSRPMYVYIRKAFRKGQVHFRSVVKEVSMNTEEMEAYLFSSDKLIDGQPPNNGRRNPQSGNGRAEDKAKRKKKKKATEEFASMKFSEVTGNSEKSGGKLANRRIVHPNGNVLKGTRNKGNSGSRFERAAIYGRAINTFQNVSKRTKNVGKPANKFQRGGSSERIDNAVGKVPKVISNHKRNPPNNRSKKSVHQAEHRNRRLESGNNSEEVFVSSRIVENSSLNANENSLIPPQASAYSPVIKREKQRRKRAEILESSSSPRRVVDVKHVPRSHIQCTLDNSG